MFDFLKGTNILDAKLLDGFVDVHSHLLPGVDDGIKTIEETRKALRFYETLGAKKIVFTPHIMEDIPTNTTIYLKQRFEDVCKECESKIELKLGAEYMIDSGFHKHLETSELLTIADNTVLVETSYLNAPLGFDDTLAKIQAKGYHVVLAHPERYYFMQIKEYEQMKNKHIQFQLNLLSLRGVYGKVVRAKTLKLLRNGWYDYVGTDMHNLQYHIKELKQLRLKTDDLTHLKKLLSKNNND